MESDFTEADLCHAMFRGARIKKASFFKGFLTQVNLQKVQSKQAEFFQFHTQAGIDGRWEF